MLIIRLEGEGALDLHSREFHVVQQHSIWGGPKHAKRQEAFQSCSWGSLTISWRFKVHTNT